MTTLISLVHLSDADLLVETVRLAARERAATARLIAAIAEIDVRRLYLGEGCASLFVSCTRVLRLSEHAAYGRIEAARAARRFPALLDLLDDGSITLTTVTLLSAHLTPENHAEVLASARHGSKREVEHADPPSRCRSHGASCPPACDSPARPRALPGAADRVA